MLVLCGSAACWVLSGDPALRNAFREAVERAVQRSRTRSHLRTSQEPRALRRIPPRSLPTRMAALPASAAFAESTGAAAAANSDAISMEACARVPAHLATGGTVRLSPLDLTWGGRAVPMSVFYGETLDGAALLGALERTLAEYQVLSGRCIVGHIYKAGSSPPTAVELSNAGVPVLACASRLTLAEALSHLPTEAAHTSPCIFARGSARAWSGACAGVRAGDAEN